MKDRARHACIIAEIGTAHAGSLAKAKTLIDAAIDAGADMVKFQWVYAHEILHKNTGLVSLPTGNIPLYERFQELETAPEFFTEAQSYAHAQGAGFACSPFGLKSLAELLAIRPDAVKIASPELNHLPLLRSLAGYPEKPPIILSAGVSLLADIEQALSFFSDTASSTPSDRLPPLSLLHCVTSYPAPETDYNLRLIENLQRIFGIAAGVSDHSLDPVLVPALSIICGGCIVEKHITLSKQTAGLDDPVALEPAQFAAMTEHIRRAEQAVSEGAEDAFIDELGARYGQDRIRAVLGDGVKRLAPCERANYGRTNRSLHIMHDMAAGDIIQKGDIAVVRTEKILSPGISPSYAEYVIGKKLFRRASSGEGLLWDHLTLDGSQQASPSDAAPISQSEG